MTANRRTWVNLDQVSDSTWHTDDLALLVIQWVRVGRLKHLNVCRVDTLVMRRREVLENIQRCRLLGFVACRRSIEQLPDVVHYRE